MDDQELQSNPFSALFPNLSVAKTFIETTKTSPESSPAKREISPTKNVNLSSEETVRDVQELNTAIEDIFLVALNKFSVLGGEQKQLIFLSSLAEIIGKTGGHSYLAEANTI